MSKIIDEDKALRDFEDLRVVVNSLRYHCEGTKSPNRAVHIIAKNTGLPKERILYLIETYL